ncbi:MULTISPECIES: DUF4193 domain-containing protein [unclassified Mycobacterium]|uniref:DUF4193 domain-containing protein n=1 Tax=Mycobacterium TaxID=1763 RepID=UPI002741D180|nr:MULTISPECIES: DUF4193 domain-containing protein [unclassified Mycobacterium]MDP7707533.1 DUF4193 domain-containing protein [Mycobacterium sp. TY815]MDP7733095.1 DUF4193 domain-containing protein [Mycobacterium sp. TY813]
MAKDYDALRPTEIDEMSEDSVGQLNARHREALLVDVDEAEAAESFELPGADLSGEDLSVRVVPKQSDEFICSRCFLVHHRSRLARKDCGAVICSDCVG